MTGMLGPVHLQGCEKRERYGNGYSEEFDVRVGVNQGSVFNSLLIVIV